MAVGTTRPTLATTWTAISDQTNVVIHHEGGNTIELAIGTSAPAETVGGMAFGYDPSATQKPFQVQLAASTFVYARDTGPAPSQAKISVMQSDSPASGSISSVVPGTGATALGKAEDAAHTSGDVGVLGLGVRNDANATQTSADGDYAAEARSSTGQTIIKPYSADGADWAYAAAASGIANTTTAVTVKAAAAAGIKNYITGVQLSSDPLGAATEFAIRDGAGGAVLWRIKIGTAGIVNPINILFANPLKGTAATLLEVVTLTASITGAVYANLQGYTGP